MSNRLLRSHHSLTLSSDFQGYTPLTIFQLAEEFFSSMNMSSMPPDFWALSVIDQPQDRHVHCQPSAWDFCNRHDYRYLHGCLFLFPIISNFYWLTVVPDVGGWLNHLWVCGIIDCTCFDLSRSMLRLALRSRLRSSDASAQVL